MNNPRARDPELDVAYKSLPSHTVLLTASQQTFKPKLLYLFNKLINIFGIERYTIVIDVPLNHSPEPASRIPRFIVQSFPKFKLDPFKLSNLSSAFGLTFYNRFT